MIPPLAQLGKTDMLVSRLGYGSMGIRGPRTWGVRVVDDAGADQILNAVLDSGINLIDTSPDYGASEDRIGRFISHRRDEYYLATKCGCVYTQQEDHLQLDHVWNRQVITKNLETSLRRLRCEFVDILQFHGGDAETLKREGLIECLRDLKRSGKVRFIGVSTSLPKLPGMFDLGVFDTYQIPYSLVAPEHASWIQKIGQAGAGVIVRGGIAQGGPDAVIARPAVNDVWQKANLDQWIDGSTSRAELILRYTLSNSDCHSTIVGTCDHRHLAENIAAVAKGPLPPELCNELRQSVAAVLATQ
ncbi:MAG TPA: aldo/keto reductase [Planctomycetaceae bacterium]|nr:aldo/keto reductase [Planctomycetaceae bacterium]